MSHFSKSKPTRGTYRVLPSSSTLASAVSVTISPLGMDRNRATLPASRYSGSRNNFSQTSSDSDAISSWDIALRRDRTILRSSFFLARVSANSDSAAAAAGAGATGGSDMVESDTGRRIRGSTFTPQLDARPEANFDGGSRLPTIRETKHAGPIVVRPADIVLAPPPPTARPPNTCRARTRRPPGNATREERGMVPVRADESQVSIF
mmetsp:Transcript_14551/g.42630  ORF Transcript_14551/g.42630 Transcript_14551/m.42630 type:complete len:207 (+) Transcript_14551:488-1108(+)